MNVKLDNQLVLKYPELYKDRYAPMTETAMCWGFECEDGWYNIIDTLSYALTYPYTSAKEKVQFYTEHLDKVIWQGKIGTQEDLDIAIKKLEEIHIPVVSQVKEKFGTLRFYVHSATDEQYNYIDFAEIMSGKTCERCGSTGTYYPMSWHKTLCDKHADEHYGSEMASEFRNKVSVSLE